MTHNFDCIGESCLKFMRLSCLITSQVGFVQKNKHGDSMFQWRETEFCNKMLKHHNLCRGEETTSPKKMVDSTIIVGSYTSIVIPNWSSQMEIELFRRVVPVTENSTGTASYLADFFASSVL